jgi:hypothetical protein
MKVLDGHLNCWNQVVQGCPVVHSSYSTVISTISLESSRKVETKGKDEKGAV